MEFGEREAQEFLEAEAAFSLAKERQVQASKVALGAAPELWNCLVEAAMDATKSYAAGVKPAQTLTASLINKNNLTIQTTSFPLVKLEILKVGSGVESKLFTMIAGLAEEKSTRLPSFRFGADAQMHPCFTNYEAEFSPQQVAHELLNPVFGLFRKLYT